MHVLNPSRKSFWLRLACFLFLSFATVAVWNAAAPTAFAQDDAGQAAAGDGTAKEEKGFFEQYIVDNISRLVFVFITSLLFSPNSWWIGIVFLAVSIVAGILIVVLLIDLRLSNAIPLGFVEEFTNHVNKRQFKQAFTLCQEDQSFLARVLTAGMGRLQYGLDDARHAAGNMVESIRRSKDQLINYVAVIGTLAPLLGLFGTVWGMIGAFQVIQSSPAEPQPQETAGQISQSLSTTFVGILMAVPALFFNTYFRNRLTRMTMDTSNLADDLLTQMYYNSRRAGASATGATAPAAPAAQQSPQAQAQPKK